METEKQLRTGNPAEQQVHFAKSASKSGATSESPHSARSRSKGSFSSKTPFGTLSARTPVVLESSSDQTTRSHHYNDKDILLQHRHVDEMVKAIHSSDHKDPCARLERAYKDLSKGFGPSTEDDEGLDASMSSIAKNENRRYAFAPKEPGVFGPVPGLGPASKGPKRKIAARVLHQADLGNAIPFARPWGAERANLDKPPWHQVQNHQKNYRKVLEDQVSNKSQVDQSRRELDRNLDRKTKTSLTVKEHGHDAVIATRERAIYKELLATVDYRQRTEREQIDADRQNGLRCASRAERQVAWQWHVKREEEKQLRLHMAQEWSSAAKKRRDLEEIAKIQALQEERETVARHCHGLVPDRRLRRSRQDCMAALDHVPPSPQHPAAQALRACPGGIDFDNN